MQKTISPLFFLCLSAVLLVFCCTYPVAMSEGAAIDEPRVRVALIREANTIQCTTTENYRLLSLHGGDVVDVSGLGDEWQFVYGNNALRVIKNGSQIGEFREPLALEPTNRSLHIISGDSGHAEGLQRDADQLMVCGAGGIVDRLSVRGEIFVQDSKGLHRLSSQGGLNLISLGFGGEKQYRGSMVFHPEGQGITLINELPVEDYLYGVLPNEMYVQWPMEALKAQAVASRSYLMAEMVKNSHRLYDVLATDQSQVYGGYSTENENANRAVRDTAGEVLISRGNYVQAFFHSSSGGFIEASSEVWLESLPYIQPKEDPYDFNENHYGWVSYYTNEQLTDQVNLKLDSMGYGVKFALLEDINTLEYTTTGARIKKMSFTGLDPGGRPLYFEVDTTDRVRVLLGLKSACFSFEKEFDHNNRLTAVTFRGDGNGHGLGMSQYGARGMALAGNNYRDILQYYYYDVEHEPNYGKSKGFLSEGY